MLHYVSRKLSVHHHHPDGRDFAYLAFIFGMGSGAFWTIFPLILSDMVPREEWVGFYYSGLSIVILGVILCSSLLFQKFSKIHILKVTLSVSIISLIFMTFAKEIWHLAGLDIPRTICVTLAYMVLSLFVADFTKKADLSVAEGKYYKYANMGFLVGPLIGGYWAKEFGNDSIFILVSICWAVALAYFQYLHVVQKHLHITHDQPENVVKKIRHHISDYLKQKNLVKIFLVAVGLGFWVNLYTIYIPLAVEEKGYGQDVIGWIMSGTILPLILLEEYVGRQAKKNGIKIYMMLGFLILAAFCFLFVFFWDNPILLLGLFTLSCAGMAFIEPLQETYFFKQAGKNKEKFLGIYNASNPLSDILAPACCSIVLLIHSSLISVWILGVVVFVLFAGVSMSLREK